MSRKFIKNSFIKWNWFSEIRVYYSYQKLVLFRLQN